jgi:Sad1 / UNC-like C-terminal
MPRKRRAEVDPSDDEEEEEEVDAPMTNGGNEEDMQDDNEQQEVEDIDEEDQEEDDEEDQEEDEDMEQEDEQEEEKKGTPSPARRRDMHLRSGKRKRGRSKDTTGLTPPDQLQNKTSARASKRSRTTPAAAVAASARSSSRRQLKTAQQRQEDPTPAAAAKTTATATVNGGANGNSRPVSDASPAAVPDPRRISYAAGAARSAASEQQDEVSDDDDDLLPPPLPFAAADMDTNGSADDDANVTTTVTATVTVTETHFVTEETQVVPEQEEADVHELVLDIPDDGRYHMLIRLGMMVGLALLFFVVWPTMVTVSSILVPLDESLLILPPQMTQTTVNEQDEERLAQEAKEWNENFVEALDKLRNLDTEIIESNEKLRNGYNHVQETFEGLMKHLRDEERSIQFQLEALTKMEGSLRDGDFDHSDQERMQAMIGQVSGTFSVETTDVRLWTVPDALDGECAREEKVATIEEDGAATTTLLTHQLLKEKESDLLLRAQMSAEKFMAGRSVANKVNSWVTSIIDKALGQHEQAAGAISRIPDLLQSAGEVSGQLSMAHGPGLVSESMIEVDQAILVRLEVDRADSTGMLDYASLKNGAHILYGGKRGTSKSLIDDLPLFNRIMHQAKLRFYGFGPETALTATYPPNALGQCWSFRQPSLKEQLKERQLYRSEKGVPDDFKRGSLGTLTIQLPKPVFVSSVVIEHVPKQLTDQADSAVRSFRVVGYEDDAASTKAWNLGVFEYSMQKNANNEYLQEFDVATSAFGNEIPALQSISLAIDSNWGHDYTCLYRFRVHGEEDEDE